MKIILIIKNILLLIRFFWWAKILNGLSKKRKLAVFLSCIFTLDDLNINHKLKICQITSLVFEFDYYADELFLNDLSRYDRALERTNNLIDKTFKSESEFIKKEFVRIKDADIRANSATDEIKYLENSKITIGLEVTVRLLNYLLNTNNSSELLDISSTIIRILSDNATIEKDKLEKNINIHQFLSYDDIRNKLDMLKNSAQKIKSKSRSDQFLIDITNLSFKFYGQNKDFEL